MFDSESLAGRLRKAGRCELSFAHGWEAPFPGVQEGLLAKAVLKDWGACLSSVSTSQGRSEVPSCRKLWRSSVNHPGAYKPHGIASH